MLVSCIMPTRGRPEWASQAVECWAAQTYPHRELVILDDIDAPSFPNGISLPGVRYEALRRRFGIGEKRNMACSRSAGSVIAHFDDDDYSAPERLSDQVARLIGSGKAVTGYRSMEFRATDGKKWLYRGAPDFAIGSSLMYRHDWWSVHPFPINTLTGEDVAFVKHAAALRQVSVAEAGPLMWASIHDRNTSPRDTSKGEWRLICA